MRSLGAPCAPPAEPDYQVTQHHAGRRTLWGAVRDALTLDAVFEKLDAALDFEEGFDVTVSHDMSHMMSHQLVNVLCSSGMSQRVRREGG